VVCFSKELIMQKLVSDSILKEIIKKRDLNLLFSRVIASEAPPRSP